MEHKIIIGSVLKPLDDVRHYYKIARSISTVENVEVHIAAHQASAIPDQSNIFFHPLFQFSRLSWKRLFANTRFFWFLVKMKPDVVICCTHELLRASSWYRVLFGAKLIYDVQESYFHNLYYSKTWIPPLNYILAVYVGLKERVFSPFIHQFWLAERIYTQQLSFIPRAKQVLLENKPLPQIMNDLEEQKPPSERVELLLCGTLAEEYGTLRAVEVIENLIKHYPEWKDKISLRIRGFGAQQSFISQLKKEVNHDWIINEISDQPVPYSEIILAMQEATIVLMPYKFGPSTAGRIPTKLWECLALNRHFIVNTEPFLNKQFGKCNVYHEIAYFDERSHQYLHEVLEQLNLKQTEQNTHSAEIFWNEDQAKSALYSILEP